MALMNFDEIPDFGRLWVFEADQEVVGFDDDIKNSVNQFLDEWTAHGSRLSAGFSWRYGRFLMIAIDQRDEQASGCSIDAMFRFVRDLGARVGADFVDRGPVAYRAGQSIERVTRAEFKELVSNGAVDGKTIVFNNTVANVGEIRSGKWEVPASDSWHRDAFF